MNRNTLILLVIVAVASAGLTRYYFPKVEFKQTEVVKEVVRTDVKTITRIIEKPDGTKETVTETTDKSVKHESSQKSTVVASKNQWMLDVGARAKVNEIQTIVYDLHVQRRILGPFFLGGRVATDKSVGVSIGMEF